MVRGPNHHWSGPHLPVSAGRLVIECFRCATEGSTDEATAARQKRLLLREFGAIRHGKVVGTMYLCGTCSLDLIRLDPDPIDATEAA